MTTHRHSDIFYHRHIGIDDKQREAMLKSIRCDSLDQLIEETVPAGIRMTDPMNIPAAMGEFEYMQHLRGLAKENTLFKSYIGLGYYDCILPEVIKRNLFENPGWYTAYTPYQAEISQGRLEALINFQTVIADLTAMEITNASLLDEETAAAEAMAMFHRSRSRQMVQAEANVFWVSDQCFPQTIDVLKTRATPLGIKLEIGATADFSLHDGIFGILLQYPGADGRVEDYRQLIGQMREKGVYVTVAADLLSLTLLTPPGEMGADAVVGSAQRFGVPMGYGGPHAAYFATREDFKRHVPGRIIGVSVDRRGKSGYRMALQTREQHIRREKATSNICTAQILLANMAGMYAVYHGPDGLRAIASHIHHLATVLDKGLRALGFAQKNDIFFDTLAIDTGSGKVCEKIRSAALAANINFRYIDRQTIGISLDETTRMADVGQILSIFAAAVGKVAVTPESAPASADEQMPPALRRTSTFLEHPVFHRYRTETEMMRYIKRLENFDISLTNSMIPLGSCTMKLNAATQLAPVSWPEFGGLHPFAPLDQAAGYTRLREELSDALCEITGFSAVSLQPNSGAQGEYAGMMVIRAYHLDRGEAQRNIALIPSSAHGTNPASAIMAGMRVVVVKCDDHGNIDVDDLKARAEKHSDELAALMVTYPSTHGVFETGIREVCELIHRHGGQVYMDGANMNAQVGLTSPGLIGADVCHLNLHKTFSIPHGGGGPGMGPIGVASHLVPYLPGHIVDADRSRKAISAVSSAPYGSTSILLISYGYIKMLGLHGLTDATRYAILNANYIKSRLDAYYPALYVGSKGRIAHELIFDTRPFKKTAGVEVEDIAKRLIDYGFHAPTVSFPVPGTMMVEPTESESQVELDRFCDAMITIYQEIKEIENGQADREDNVLKNAPHSAEEVMADDWAHAYTREKAAYPLPYLRTGKYWPPVSRIDNAYGDRNLFCVCPPIEEVAEVLD